MNTIMLQVTDEQYDAILTLLGNRLDELAWTAEPSHASEDWQTDWEKERTLLHDLRDQLEEWKAYLWTSGCGRIELEISPVHVDAIAVSGDNEPAVKAALKSDGFLQRQLMETSQPAMREHLKDAGIEGVNDKSDEEVTMYILWMACHDIAEERLT